ncbi:DEAD/DEAH box helicase family protein [Tenacibaculum finnmarkense genomovar ulcerans]|uniref:DEAD/DEAH box helicase n=1 Tax=Tenacibaculum finnmarkense TaxID=2781243 RepID=UPI00187B23A5|nr:DEAD/DEAH box helicase [Tenacibaculum finnmarkense]MBE7632814.1 DEAD/DEAH box helicase family protein [Tenacibaculum finnmarkense genomovar ulcerans]MCD8428683.1 DEAD/DEAH box helicase [Tenacibaculum finnmarkense genomovar ulcerans]
MKLLKRYTENVIEFYYEKKSGEIIPFYNWIDNHVDSIVYNILNDLLINGIAQEIEGEIIIKNEDLSLVEQEDFSFLGLSEFYPFEIFISLKGAGLKDKNGVLQYSYQDKTNKNGTGNIIFKTSDRKGVLLENKDSTYLLENTNLNIVQAIDEFNTVTDLSEKEHLKRIANVQLLASKCNNIFLSRILSETIILNPETFELNVQKIAENKYRITPKFEEVNQTLFDKKFNLLNRVKDEYSYSENGNKIRVLIDNSSEKEGVKIELEKIKKQKTYSNQEISEMVETPSKFWNTDLLNLDDFGKRVAELGIYQPKFYPFISPYKSQWLPGIAIEDVINGTRLISIENNEQLSELKTSVKKAEYNGNKDVFFKGEYLDIQKIQAVIENAEKQLSQPENAIIPQKENQNKEVRKVLIIKENTEITEYVENIEVITNANYSLREISNLSDGIQLKKHQREGVAWLQTLSQAPYNLPGVLLADDMGLGKTIQVLYFLEWYYQNGNTKPSLVVAPVSLLENWEQEHKKFFKNSNLDIKLLWGNQVRNYIHVNDKELTIKSLSKSGLYLTTYETLRRHQIPFAMVNWGIVALDEVQRIKTPGTLVTNASKALKSYFKIAMTGTPVENSLVDLWCIMDFCNPGLLLDTKTFTKEYIKPLNDTETNFEELSKILRAKIGESFMRRMKIDVAKDLPSITPKNERIHLQEMPAKQYKVYVDALSDIENMKESGKQGATLEGIHNLKSISDHPFLKSEDLTSLDIEEVINSSAKLIKTIAIINAIKIHNEKVIVFSQNKKMQRVFRRVFLEKYNLNIAIINGDTPSSASSIKNMKLSRQQEVDKFQQKLGFNIIVMSPIAAGFGLNITGANHVIHYTRHWNPAKENQATDRAYRIGQTKTVHVYYPIAIAPNEELKTFDIVLNTLLENKSELASNTLFPSENIEIQPSEFLEAFYLKE